MGLRPTQGDEERWWRELQLAASASAGGRAATFGMSLECEGDLLGGARASDDLDSLDRTIGRRIREGFRHYAEADHGDVIRLKDGRKAFHLHVDDSQKETKIWSSRAKECGSQKGQPSG